MTYDFQTLPNRRGTGSSKWEEMLADNPNLDSSIVPLSVADMEFVTPKPIKDALHALAVLTGKLAQRADAHLLKL